MNDRATGNDRPTGHSVEVMHGGGEFMRRALRIAARGLFTTDPNPRVGCVLVKDGKIVGEGWHQHAGGPHAEIHALRDAGEMARGATAYVTLEPCCHHGRTGPCSKALIDAGVARVVAAMLDPNPQVGGQGMRELTDAGIAIEHGAMAADAAALNPGFIKRMSEARPFVRCKMAMSLDGRTAMASGESQWITGEAARADVQQLRARSSAIVTGIGTVLADDPAMTVRIAAAEGRQPLRVVLDSNRRLPVNANILHQPGPVMLAGIAPIDSAYAAALPESVELATLPANSDGRVDLSALLNTLSDREMNEVHLECGTVLAGAFMQAGLIDELVVYMAPVLMGDDAYGLFHLPGLERMAERVELDIDSIRALDKDWRITARPRGTLVS